jgi:hypothetical protein
VSIQNVVAIQLRAERCGNSPVERVFTVTVMATDDETTGARPVAKTVTTTFTVTVPHDQGQ